MRKTPVRSVNERNALKPVVGVFLQRKVASDEAQPAVSQVYQLFPRAKIAVPLVEEQFADTYVRRWVHLQAPNRGPEQI